MPHRDPHRQHRLAFVAALARALEKTPDAIDPEVRDADPAHGDFAFACFPLAKVRRQAPPAIAAALANELRVPGLTIAAAGGYVNARVDDAALARDVLESARAAGDAWGGGDAGAGKTVTIDFSSPNIAKPIAFHHIRSTVIGNALARLYRAQGWRVEGINYLGDWGKQFGLVAVGFEEYGDPARRGDMGHLVEVYVKANERAEKDPAFDERARAFFKRMEQKDEAALAVWRELRDTSLKEFARVYARLGVRFDHIEGESRYQDTMDAAIEQVRDTVGVAESEGALIVDMPYAKGQPPVLLRKNDGTTLYATRDIAAALDRFARFHFDRSLYVVATDQSLHFQQLFRVLDAMKLPWAGRCVHVNFGRVHGMSTRKGKVVLLADVLDEAKGRALDRVRENAAAGKIHTDDAELLAEQIGLAAVVFGDLKNRRDSDYTFDLDKFVDFEGETGPYLQYAHARACAILRKATEAGVAIPSGAPSPERLALPEEQALVRAIAKLPTAFAAAVEENEPSRVARLLLEVTGAFSRWYTVGNQDRSARVLVEEAALRDARLALTDAARITLRAGLAVLGIPAPESM